MEAARVVIKAGTVMAVLCLLFYSGCVSPLRIDGPYRGRVIDVETGRPIADVVALGTWYKIHPTPAGRSSEYYDSYETLTDQNGEFNIPGQGLLVLSSIEDMTLTIFKAGYTQFPSNSNWSGLVQFGPFDRVAWDEDGKGIFKLRKMTIEERMQRGVTFPTLTPKKKMRMLVKERNKEMVEIGRPKTTLLPEE